MSRTARQRLAFLVFAAAGAWLAFGFAKELYHTLYLEVLHPGQPLPAVVWRHSTPQARRLQAFLERAAEQIPPGSRVGFATEATPPGEAFFRWLRAGYWLPGSLLIPEGAPESRAADYWITFRRKLEQPDRVLLLEQGPGRLYRTVRSGEAR